MKSLAVLIYLFDRFNNFYSSTKTLDEEMGQNVHLCIALVYVDVVGHEGFDLCVSSEVTDAFFPSAFFPSVINCDRQFRPQ